MLRIYVTMLLEPARRTAKMFDVFVVPSATRVIHEPVYAIPRR